MTSFGHANFKTIHEALYKELRAFLSSVIGAVVLAVFLLVSGLFHWVFPGQWNLLETGVAEPRAFSCSPLGFSSFLIPAITMRSIAEERKNGTLELLLTHPLDPTASSGRNSWRAPHWWRRHCYPHWLATRCSMLWAIRWATSMAAPCSPGISV